VGDDADNAPPRLDTPEKRRLWADMTRTAVEMLRFRDGWPYDLIEQTANLTDDLYHALEQRVPPGRS